MNKEEKLIEEIKTELEHIEESEINDLDWYAKRLIDLVRGSDVAEEERRFPVLGYSKYEGCPKFVKWSELDDNWATHVHSQSLERLASRGGLSPVEIVFNVNKLEWATKVCPKFAVDLVKRIAATNQ
jgi:hypothetical protein